VRTSAYYLAFLHYHLPFPCLPATFPIPAYHMPSSCPTTSHALISHTTHMHPLPLPTALRACPSTHYLPL